MNFSVWVTRHTSTNQIGQYTYGRKGATSSFWAISKKGPGTLTPSYIVGLFHKSTPIKIPRGSIWVSFPLLRWKFTWNLKNKDYLEKEMNRTWKPFILRWTMFSFRGVSHSFNFLLATVEFRSSSDQLITSTWGVCFNFLPHIQDPSDIHGMLGLLIENPSILKHSRRFSRYTNQPWIVWVQPLTNWRFYCQGPWNGTPNPHFMEGLRASSFRETHGFSYRPDSFSGPVHLQATLHEWLKLTSVTSCTRWLPVVFSRRIPYPVMWGCLLLKILTCERLRIHPWKSWKSFSNSSFPGELFWIIPGCTLPGNRLAPGCPVPQVTDDWWFRNRWVITLVWYGIYIPFISQVITNLLTIY